MSASPDLSCPDLRQARGHVGEHHFNLPRDHIVQGLGNGLVGHAQHIDVCGVCKHGAWNERPRAARGVAQFAWFRFRQGDEFRECFCGNKGMDHQQRGCVGKTGDRREILDRVVDEDEDFAPRGHRLRREYRGSSGSRAIPSVHPFSQRTHRADDEALTESHQRGRRVSSNCCTNSERARFCAALP